jgi:MFS family permease
MSKLIGLGHDAVRLRTRWVIRLSSIRIQTNSLKGVFGGIIVGQDFIEYFDHPSPAMQGFVTSVYDLGCFVGAIITLFVGERLGRRWTMLVFTVIMGSGIIFQTASHSMTQMVGSISRYQ